MMGFFLPYEVMLQENTKNLSHYQLCFLLNIINFIYSHTKTVKCNAKDVVKRNQSKIFWSRIILYVCLKFLFNNFWPFSFVLSFLDLQHWHNRSSFLQQNVIDDFSNTSGVHSDRYGQDFSLFSSYANNKTFLNSLIQEMIKDEQNYTEPKYYLGKL